MQLTTLGSTIPPLTTKSLKTGTHFTNVHNKSLLSISVVILSVNSTNHTLNPHSFDKA
jgi:hypothetical protein